MTGVALGETSWVANVTNRLVQRTNCDGVVGLRTPKMREDCGDKGATFGTAAERKRRWRALK